MELSFHEKLVRIQSELKAPKNQFNRFGKYNYRSCEDILEAVKPLLKQYDMRMTISDSMKEVGGRVYVESSVTLVGSKGEVTVTASAREPETKKGMDDSQITGSASSYARKYALNGLFLIDDTKDADATNEHNKGESKQDEKPWYNDFESHKEAMLNGIKSGEKTADSIIKNLEQQFKISNKIKDEIRGLK